MDDDYDDYDYYKKPRLQLASGVVRRSDGDEGEPFTQSAKAAYCSVGVLGLALGLCTTGILQFFACWIALGFLLGPFAPMKFTGGDCRVGEGEEVEFEEEPEEGEETAVVPTKKPSGTKTLKDSAAASAKATLPPSKASGSSVQVKGGWSREAWDQLRKLLVKFPRGTPQRWEAVARALSTKRSTEEIIGISRFMQECSDKDPYEAFIAQNPSASKTEPPVAVRTINAAPSQENLAQAEALQPLANGSGAGWSAEQDKSLLQALKRCPKDTPQRWEKIAECVSGRTKAECMKRYSELKDSFKAKKSTEAGPEE